MANLMLVKNSYADRIHENRKLIETYFDEVWSKGRVELLDELVTSDYINHTPSSPNPIPGPAGLKPIILEMRKGFPDLHYDIQDLIITADRIVARTIVRGTHIGQLWGMQPTRKKFEISQINIEYIKNGKISEHWGVTDEHALLNQLWFQ
jgi:predicted ester cyclase